MTHPLVERIEFLRRGMAVRRFHTVPGECETVGHHSAGVALLIATLNPFCSAALLKAALTHDLAEWVTGDVPAQVKWANPQLADDWEQLEQGIMKEWNLDAGTLTPDELLWLKWCDTLDLMLHARDQMRLGNSYYRLIYERGAQRFEKDLDEEKGPMAVRAYYVRLAEDYRREFGAFRGYEDSNPRSYDNG